MEDKGSKVHLIAIILVILFVGSAVALANLMLRPSFTTPIETRTPALEP